MPAKVVTNATRNDLYVFGMLHAIRLNADDTNGDLTLSEIQGQPGMGVPPHIHKTEDETFHILSGKLEFWLDGKTFVGEAGTTVFLPRNVPHGFQVVGDQPAHFLVYVSPAGIEAMFAELAALPAGPPDVHAVTAICDKHNIEILPMIK